MILNSDDNDSDIFVSHPILNLFKGNYMNSCASITVFSLINFSWCENGRRCQCLLIKSFLRIQAMLLTKVTKTCKFPVLYLFLQRVQLTAYLINNSFCCHNLYHSLSFMVDGTLTTACFKCVDMTCKKAI